MQFLFEIEDVFDISGRGCVVVQGVPFALGRDVKVGEPILVVTPQGNELRTNIAGFEIINRGRLMSHAPFSLPRDVKKANLPIGSKVYIQVAGDA